MQTREKQEFIRRKLNNHISRHGLKANWVCRQCGGIDNAVMSRFRSGKKELWDDTLNLIEEFLDNCN